MSDRFHNRDYPLNENYRSRGGGSGNRGGGDYRRGPSDSSGRGAGPGSRKAPGDDSSTSKLPTHEPKLFAINELSNSNVSCSKKDLQIITNGYEIDISKAKQAFQYDIEWKGWTKNGTYVDLNKQTKNDVKFQRKQIALRSVFFKLLYSDPIFFKIHEGDANYAYDSGRMFFSQNKILNEGETKELIINVESFDKAAKDF